jgi:AP-1 complex subunit mu
MSRNYRGDIDMSCIEKFMPLMMEKEEEHADSPVYEKDGISYVYVKHMNIFRKFVTNICINILIQKIIY